MTQAELSEPEKVDVTGVSPALLLRAIFRRASQRQAADSLTGTMSFHDVPARGAVIPGTRRAFRQQGAGAGTTSLRARLWWSRQDGPCPGASARTRVYRLFLLFVFKSPQGERATVVLKKKNSEIHIPKLTVSKRTIPWHEVPSRGAAAVST